MTSHVESNGGGFALSPTEFATAFPFGFLVDEECRVTSLGRGLERRRGLDVGISADDLFEVVRPRGRETLASAVGAIGRLVVLRTVDGELELKGQILEQPNGFAFLGTTAVKSLDELKAQNLQLIDFAPQDSTPDLLLTLQVNETSLRNARELASELEDALQKAHAAVEAKARFLAMMSHEIRTPLNGLSSMVDILRAGDLDDGQLEALGVINDSSESLAVLLNDILDLSKIEAGAVVLETIPFAPRSSTESVGRLFAKRAEDKGIDLAVQVDADVPAWVLGDPTRYRQVLSNLLGNAIKFTTEGSVRVVLRAPEEGRLELDVIDTGIGITDDARERLFRPFTQADESVTRRFGGTGLGLVISRELAHLMGGDVAIAETGSRGTTFRFTLRAEETDSATATHVGDACDLDSFVRSLRVLVAEDHPTNRVIVDRLLRQLGIEPTIVEDGALAVEAVRKEAYDVVLMDLGMPVMDGAEAAQRIRQLDVEWSQLPILAFTAGAFAEDRIAAREAGMNGYLTKPVRLAQLRRALQSVSAT